MIRSYKNALLTLLITTGSAFSTTFKLKRISINDAQEKIVLTVTPDADQIIFHDTIDFSSNNPTVAIKSWTSDPQPTSHFDKNSKETRLGYQSPFTIELNLSSISNGTDLPSELFMHYLTNNLKGPQEQRFVLHEHTPETAVEPTTSAATSSNESSLTPVTTVRSFAQLIYDAVHNIIKKITSSAHTAKEFISTLFTSAESRPAQFALALLLGILMSLTPCIYPMIPVTVGLLGTGGHNSLLRNFSLAFSYTLGLASTFAVIGLFATLFGTQFGQILSNPFFVIALVTILAYLGGSMLGIYEMRIPRFLQPRSQTVQKGSYLSAFLFGMGSGTIASPCMSPGLALVLSVVNKIVATSTALNGVASWGDTLLGFALLFVFGIGSSMPLLIIGTFSASLHILPRAGMWMVEIKKVFGFMLIGMCFYYLSNIMPAAYILALTALFFLMVGAYYFKHALASRRGIISRILSYLFAIALIATGFYTGYLSYQATQPQESLTVWRSDYEQAHAQAIAENKKMLLDFGAAWCSLCTAIERTVLTDPALNEVLSQVIAVKIDGSQHGAEPYTTLFKQFKLLGLPSILLIDPTNDTIVRQWNSELLNKPRQEFIDELTQHLGA